MSLEFRHIGHAYGKLRALDSINLTAVKGEITCLLGESGCGKTTLLQLAAGLQSVQQGEIFLNGETLANSSHNPAPENRPVGLVFQEGALFPHMSIAQNIGFGLNGDAEPALVIEKWLGRIGLDGLQHRYPHMLSGGQQQRVALARAMAPEPEVLLMDEPFANIDVVLRRSLRNETRHILKERAATTILVTHDPQEAMEIGDRIAVMDKGHIVQMGSADDLFDNPVTLSVGLMFGDSQAVGAHKTDHGIKTAFGIWPVSCLTNGWPDGSNIKLLVRPAALKVTANPTGMPIIDMRRAGKARRLTIASETEELITVDISTSESLHIGEKVSIEPDRHSLMAFTK